MSRIVKTHDEKQLSLFGTGINCWHCNNDPGRQDKNGHLWNGFFDADTQQRVCRKCRTYHYGLKSKTEFSGMYSELPVAIVPTLLNHHEHGK